MKLITRIAGLLTLCICGVACQSDLSMCDNDRGLVEFFTWWQPGAELDAANAVISVHTKTYPNTTVLHSTMGNQSLFAGFLQRRMEKGRIPDSFQTNIGTNLLTWVETSPKQLEPLDKVWSERNRFDPTIVADASQGDVPYCIPLGIHRISTLFYNARLLAQQGIAVNSLSTLEGFRTACAALHAAGVPPISLGIQDASWTLAQLVHENLLPAIAGADYYNKFWRGQGNPGTDQQLRDVYNEIIGWLHNGWINADFETLPWKQAEARILDDSSSSRAAFFIMGDWASGDLREMATERGLDQSAFGRLPFPTNNPFFVYTADCFPLPLGAPHRSAAIELLNTFASIDGQLAFSKKKGSIPARQDVPTRDFDPAQIATISQFYQTQTSKLLAVSGIAPPGALTDLNSKLVEMLKARDPDVILNYWRVNYGQLQ